MLKLAYHPATYLRQDVPFEDALVDMSRTGWDGFEWYPRGLAPYYADPAAFKNQLGDLDIEVSGIYCSCGFKDDAETNAWRATIDETIPFAQAVGAEFIMLDGGSRDLPQTPASIQRIADHANAVAAQVTEAGLGCTWHQHWGTLFQYPAEFHALMDATDPARIKCTPDTAQLALGGFDLPATFDRYVSRMAYVHFKDLDSDRKFIELGRGVIEFEPLAEALGGSSFSGWIVVDLDYTSLEPGESSRINLEYLHSTLGLIGRRGLPLHAG